MKNDLFNLDNSILKDYFNKYENVYEIINDINKIIIEIGKNLNNEYTMIKDNVWVHKSVTIDSGVEIIGPSVIMENTRLRHNAYLRENVIIGPNSVIGNSSEIKNSILISNCEVPHFNYVGDSILGDKAHLGAGVILSNLRLDKRNIQIDGVDTKLRKMGALVGDNVQIGCNSVINPGTIIYPNTMIYPLSVVKGIVKTSVYKNDHIEVKKI